MRKVIMFMMVAALAIIIAGCQRQAAQPTPPAVSTPGEMSDMGDAQMVNVVAREFAFEPKEIRVKPGVVRFAVKNEGTVEHDFEIVGAAEHGAEHEQKLFKAGETYTLEADLKPGRYEAVCNVPGHKESGMVATVVVE